MLTIHLLWIAGIISWLWFLWSRRRYYLLMLELPGLWEPLHLGFALEVLMQKMKLSVLTRHFNRYGSTIFTWIGPFPLLATRDPQTVEDILTSPECLDRGWLTGKAIEANIGPGVLSLNEPHWSPRRRQLNVAFKHPVLLSFFPTFNAETNVLLTRLDSHVDQGEGDVLSEVLRWSFRISFQSTLGTDPEAAGGSNSDLLLKRFETALQLVVLNIVAPFTLVDAIAQVCGMAKQREKYILSVHPILDSIIEKRISSQADSETQRNLVIDQAIDLYRKGLISLADLRSECAIMVVAAFETTALSVYHTLALLAMHPEHQDTVFEELKDVFPTAGCFDVSFEDVQQLVYLERVLNETLRLIPSVPLSPRENAKDFRLSSGVVIPKGVMILVDVFNTNRNPDVWGPDATKFNPDHFLPENVRQRHPYGYIAFSKGRRNCIGWRYALLSSKLALAKILRNYKVSTSFRFEDLDFIENLGMKLAKVPRLAFERRT